MMAGNRGTIHTHVHTHTPLFPSHNWIDNSSSFSKAQLSNMPGNLGVLLGKRNMKSRKVTLVLDTSIELQIRTVFEKKKCKVLIWYSRPEL